MVPIMAFSSMKGLMFYRISILTWEGVQIIITLDPGITSLGSLETLFIFPVNNPILAQSDFSVLATILSLQFYLKFTKIIQVF
jgi:hypothetical protein